MERFDVIMIGAGPAGMSAAVYATSRGLRTLVLEADDVGGMIGRVSTVTHYAAVSEGETGRAFAARLRAQAQAAGAVIETDRVTDVRLAERVKPVTCASGARYEASRVIVATGMRKRTLSIPGDHLLAGSAQDEAPRFQGRAVYVVGGADGAVKEALHLARFARSVTIVCAEERLSCIAQFREAVERTAGIRVIGGSTLHALEGDDQAERVVVRDLTTGALTSIDDPSCGVFVYAGATPASELAHDQLQLEGGFIVANERMETALPGVYVAGDVRAKQVRQVATAVADGAIAAINAAQYQPS
ncbi:FAD-dependent oxidoreductase [Eggerthellaceae bacterium zg-997]|nr:FAD-dependent oxidoreductase [Eggerthellaceae bacterium zg-997]